MDSISPERFISDWWETAVKSSLSTKKLAQKIRQYDKIYLEANSQASEYTLQKHRIEYSFESLFRAVGLGAGVLFGGPLGAVTLSYASSQVGKAVGGHLGNKIYGNALRKLEEKVDSYKYKQLINFYAKSYQEGKKKLIDEFYDQAYRQEQKTIQGLEQR